MLKRKIFAFTAALAMASSVSVSAIGASPDNAPGRIVDLDACQLAQLSRCLKLGLDYNYCYDYAVESYECPPA
jgi:hypothetical protein